MKKTLFKSAALFALAILMIAGVNAQPPKGNGPGMGKSNVKFSLNLSEEQQEQMKALRIEHYKELKPLKYQMAELKAGYRTLMAEETVDMKLLGNNIDQQTALMNKTQKLQAYHQIKVKEILTDEQEMMIARKQIAGKHQSAGRSGGPGNRKGPNY